MNREAPLFDWLHARSAGVLLHPTSLPTDTGIGNLGAAAFRFVDFLHTSGLRVWQMCPLGPTGYGDSPYQCFSAFAANPYFIDPAPLADDGLLEDAELEPLRRLPRDRVDYGGLYETFWPILRQAYARFRDSGADSVADYGTLRAFREAQAHWLEDYARFMALKNHCGGRPWQEWPEQFRDYAKASRQSLPDEVADDIEAQVFFQYVVYAQLVRLRRYATSRNVSLLGDVPIFVALDSADVWANRELFQLDAAGEPTAVAGVPPDYFSDDGQLWGNPLFAWEAHRATDFRWWTERVRANLSFYDIVRLDHFRGFEACWSVPADAKTAKAGKWTESPGRELFRAIRKACPEAKLVAEDLGLITDAVRELRAATGLPGMAVLHFAFGGDAGNAYLPHNHERNMVVYSGTHDNNTTAGWYASLDEGTRDHVRRYLSVSGDSISWDLVRAAIRSTARMAVFPLQDLLGLGGEARLNRPGAPEGNWQWRYTPEQLDGLEHDSAPYLREVLGLFGRLPDATDPAQETK